VNQARKAEVFRDLHRPGDPVVLVNVWDAWSARVVAEAGFPALATSSHSLAEAAGYADGEKIPVAGMARLGVARVSLAIWPFEFVRTSLRSAVERFARERDHRVFAPPGQ
jgi:2-methylisocitrate lyase-like PEP mutase family enzyme